jgi:hypothetical protein
MELRDCTDSGLPMSMRRELDNVTWYEVAVMFCDMKWKRWAPRSRRSAAEALATVAGVLVEGRNAPELRSHRRALEEWTFNKAARESGEVPEEHAVTIDLLQEHSIPVGRLTDSAVVRLALSLDHARWLSGCRHYGEPQADGLSPGA